MIHLLKYIIQIIIINNKGYDYMIIWLILLLMIAIVYVFRSSIKEANGLDVCVVLISIFVLLNLFTYVCCSREYKSSKERIVLEKSNCEISPFGKDYIKVSYKGIEYIVNKNTIVYYDAPDKNSEVVEISYQRRIYEPIFPLMYRAYYMEDPRAEQTMVIMGCNISKFNVKEK